MGRAGGRRGRGQACRPDSAPDEPSLPTRQRLPQEASSRTSALPVPFRHFPMSSRPFPAVPGMIHRAKAFRQHQEAALQVYSTDGEGSEVKPNSWGTSLSKVLVCFLLLAGVIAISTGAGLAEERNYSVAALGTSASPLSDTAQSPTFLRKNQTVADRACTVGSTTAFCGDREACCTGSGRPMCCTGGCGGVCR
jgi:hypothetical protein